MTWCPNTCAASPAPSPGARPRSSATSLASACSACRGDAETMDLHPDTEAEALRLATAEWLADNLGLAVVRNPPQGLWSQLEEMGWADLTRAEGAGGMGLDHATEALVFAELGRHLAPLALIASAVA